MYVGIRKLKARLSELIEKAARWSVIRVTERAPEQVRYFKRLGKRVDLKVLAGDEMWR